MLDRVAIFAWLISFLLGSIPFGLLIARLFKVRDLAHQGSGRRRPGQTRGRRPAARPGPGTRGHRPGRRVLRPAAALPERRLLHRAHLQGDGLPDEDVHGALRSRSAARLDRSVARDDGRPGDQDRPSPADLHRGRRAYLRGDRLSLDPGPTRYAAAAARQGRQIGVIRSVRPGRRG